MKALFISLPIIVGICTVLQSTLNKRISDVHGLSYAIFVTSAVVLVLSIVLLKFMPASAAHSAKAFNYWYLVPGFFGFLVITLIPISIEKAGAVNTFILIIASQLVASGLWDKFIEGISFSTTRSIGIALSLIGAWLSTKN